MKKFTLFAAVAALTVSSAFAAAPQKSFAVKAEKTKAELTTNSVAVPVAKALNLDNSVNATEGEGDNVTVDMNASYAPAQNSFYMGLYPDAGAYKVTLGLTGIRGELPFYNLTQGADAYSWEFAKEAGQDDAGNVVYDYYTSTETHGFMPLTPLSAYNTPTLTATFGTDEISYANENCVYYLTGGALKDWGFSDITDPENYDYTQLVGVSPCAAAPHNFSLIHEYTINRPGSSTYNEENFDANGTSANWYAYSNENQVLENMKITAYGTYIPAMPSAYQINSTWAWINSLEATEDITLPVVVYAVNDEGRVDYNTVLGAGEYNFSAGAFTMDVMPGAPLYAVDADGYTIDAPVCVPAGQPVMVCIEGLDNPALLSFNFVCDSGTTFSMDFDRKNLLQYLWPTHAYTFFDMTITTPGSEPKEISTMLDPAYIYYTQDKTGFWAPTDLAMYFDVNFPTVLNPADSTADFTVEVPAEGGEVVVPVYCDYMIDALIEEQLVTVATSDFVTATQAFDAENGITNVTITVAANTAEARTGYVVYEGFGIDFYITVKQAAGEEGGINSVVVNPVAKGTKFFDLQGRQLQAAPAAGMYIESVNGVATKQIAR